MGKRGRTEKRRKSIFLQLFLLILLSSIFYIVIYSAMQEGNHKRRIIVPEAIDAPYQPYRSTENRSDHGMVTPMDSMMRDVYVVQREINQGSHQLYLFFDTFTHEPAHLDLKHFDLKNPKDAQWYNFGIYLIMFLLVVFPTISAFIAKNFLKGKIKKNSEYVNDTVRDNMDWINKTVDFVIRNKIMIVFIVFLIAILLSMVNLSIPLEKEFEYRADPFFVFVCFSSIAVAVIALKYVVKGLKRIKIGGETSLSGKSVFRQTLFWGALGIWAMGFLCYFIGMYSLGTQKSVLASIVRPALESGKMFVLSDSTKEISFTLRNNGAFMGFYTLSKLGFLLISSFALVSLAWSRIVSYSTIRKRSIDPGDLYVFFGMNENSKILAHDVAQKLREEKKIMTEKINILVGESEQLAKRSKELANEMKQKSAESGMKLAEKSEKQAEENEKLSEDNEESSEKIEGISERIEVLSKKIEGISKKKDELSKKKENLDEEIKTLANGRGKRVSKRMRQANRNKELASNICELAEDIETLAEKSKELARESKELAKENQKGWTIVMVENRNNPIEGMGNGISISSLMGMFNFRRDAYAETREVDKRALLVISDSAIGSRECNEQIQEVERRIENGEELDKAAKYDLFNSLGLKNVSKMIKNTNGKTGCYHKCHFFFLDDDARTNIDATDNLRKMLNIVHPDNTVKTIYCLARNNAFSSLLERPIQSGGNSKTNKVNVKILDLSVMASQSLFIDPNNHPINFVDCDTATATVKSRFEALLLGFGRGGRDIVRYLYEFGAFLDHNQAAQGKRSPFQCTIMDKDIDVIRPRYMAKIPAVASACNHDDKKDSLLQFKTAALNSDRFVELIDKKLRNEDMNFVVISMGNDKTNMGALTYLVDQAMKVRKGNLGKLRIFVRNYDPTYEDTMREQAEHYNQLLGNKPVVNIFGRRSDLLSYNMVVADKIINSAKEFHKIYVGFKNHENVEKDKDVLWAIRHNQGQGVGLSDNENQDDSNNKWRQKNRILRQETQDIYNGIHVDTKLKLIGLKRHIHYENELDNQVECLLGLKKDSHLEVELSNEQKEKQDEIQRLIQSKVKECVRNLQPTSFYAKVWGWLKALFLDKNIEIQEDIELKTNEILNALESNVQYRNLLEEVLPFSDEGLVSKIHDLKEAIKFNSDGTSYQFETEQIEGMDITSLYINLARNEHLRWVASLEMLGYTAPKRTDPKGMEECDEAAKIHPGLTDKNSTDYQDNQHAYDHVLIRSSFELIYNELKRSKESFVKARKEAIEEAVKKAFIVAIKKQEQEQQEQKKQKKHLKS